MVKKTKTIIYFKPNKHAKTKSIVAVVAVQSYQTVIDFLAWFRQIFLKFKQLITRSRIDRQFWLKTVIKTVPHKPTTKIQSLTTALARSVASDTSEFFYIVPTWYVTVVVVFQGILKHPLTPWRIL